MASVLAVKPHSLSLERLQTLLEEVENLRSAYTIDLNNSGLIGMENLFSASIWVFAFPGEAGAMPLTNFYTFVTHENSIVRSKLVPLLQGLLADDPHIAACCPSPYQLARAIEIVSPSIEPLQPRPWYGERAKEAAKHLVGQIYSMPFQRLYSIHFYNLALAGSLNLGQGCLLHEEEAHGIPTLTGESTAFSTIHDPRTGHVFLTIDKSATPEKSDLDEWDAAWSTAFDVVQVLKYLKYGIVEIDYGGLRFTPMWVNSVRRVGIAIRGMPRRDIQPERYTLEATEAQQVVSWWRAYQRLRAELDDPSSTLRETTDVAGTYFESHHKRVVLEEQLIDLAIALEALFSPDEKQGEFRFRIGQRAAILLGRTFEDRKEIAAFVRKAYDARSGLVHSGKSPFQSGNFSESDLARLGNLIREAILRFMALYIGGIRDKKSIHDRLDKCAYDSSLADKMIEESSPERALAMLLGGDAV